MPCNYKNYPKDWKQIRERILLRENNCCKFCNVPNYEIIYRPVKGSSEWKLMPEGSEADMLVDFEPWIKFTKVILTIAHLDHDKENHEVSDDRLAALCQRCHLIYDLSRHIAKRKANRLEKLNNLTLDL
jgi:5-methylcytosine-specific restriction endonuclease McrA